jgi:hypothetical protein
VTVWLAPQILGTNPSWGDVARSVRSAHHGLWIAQALAIAVAGPRALGPTFRDGAMGLLVLIAVPLPLLSFFWMTGAVSAGTLLAGTGLLGILAALALAAGGGLRRLGRSAWTGPWRAPAVAVLELGLVAGIWMHREALLSWTNR